MTYDSGATRPWKRAPLQRINYAASGNSPLLDQVFPPAGSRQYTFGDAGHLEFFDAGANEVDFEVDDEGRVESITREPGGQEQEDAAAFTYDGRSFLYRTDRSHSGGSSLAYVAPTYGSEGRLYGLVRQDSPTGPVEELSVFYFAGRPVAQLKTVDLEEELIYLTTDHLGTPLLATDDGGFDIWAGPLEPFGEDTFQNALGSDVFLRLPGQWVDSIWQGASLGVDVYYNVHRWYEFGAGRYSRPDPLGINGGGPNVYIYAVQRPLFNTDPLGQAVVTQGCRSSDAARLQAAAGDADAASQTCLPCENRDDFRRAIRDDLVVICDYFPMPETCAGTTPAGEVVIFPGGLNRPGRCGCLKSVVLHEVLHLIDFGDENNILDQARKCFSCAQGVGGQ